MRLGFTRFPLQLRSVRSLGLVGRRLDHVMYRTRLHASQLQDSATLTDRAVPDCGRAGISPRLFRLSNSQLPTYLLLSMASLEFFDRHELELHIGERLHTPHRIEIAIPDGGKDAVDA